MHAWRSLGQHCVVLTPPFRAARSLSRWLAPGDGCILRQEARNVSLSVRVACVLVRRAVKDRHARHDCRGRQGRECICARPWAKHTHTKYKRVPQLACAGRHARIVSAGSILAKDSTAPLHKLKAPRRQHGSTQRHAKFKGPCTRGAALFGRCQAASARPLLRGPCSQQSAARRRGTRWRGARRDRARYPAAARPRRSACPGWRGREPAERGRTFRHAASAPAASCRTRGRTPR